MEGDYVKWWAVSRGRGSRRKQIEGLAERAINKTTALLISVGQRQWEVLPYSHHEWCTCKNKPGVLG